MITPIAPYNKIFVEIENRFQDEITMASGIKFFIYTGTAPEQHAALVGKVISVPKKIKRLLGYEEAYMPHMEAGDTVLMRYDVVHSYKDQPDRANPVHRNELYHLGHSYWKCDILKLIAVKRGDGWDMANGYAMVDIIEEDRKLSNIIFDPNAVQRRRDKGILQHIGDSKLNCRVGDMVYFLPQFVQQYALGQKGFYVIKQKYIYGYDRK